MRGGKIYTGLWYYISEINIGDIPHARFFIEVNPHPRPGGSKIDTGGQGWGVKKLLLASVLSFYQLFAAVFLAEPRFVDLSGGIS